MYLALVHGAVTARVEVDARIADTEPKSYKMVVGSDANAGRESLTEIIPLALGVYRGAVVTKVALIPRTGRRHQLRIHAMHVAHPIVGDATYIDEALERAYYGRDFCPPRMMLHAARLRLKLPEGVVKGRKSGIRQASWRDFRGGDPYDHMEGWEEGEVIGSVEDVWDALIAEMPPP